MTDVGSQIIAKARSYVGQLHDGPDVPQLAQAVAAAFPEFGDYAREATATTPWCGIFIAFVLSTFGIRPPPAVDGVGFMYVDRWLDFGVSVPVGQEQPGDIAIFLGNPSPHHVTFVAGNGTYIGGNQADGVTIAHFRTPDAIRRASAAAPLSTSPVEFYPLIKLGSTGEAVIELQRLLHVEPDGEFGADTDTAVRNFQLTHGLDIDGEVGPLTWAALLGQPSALPANAQTSKGSWYSQFSGKYEWRDDQDAPNSAALTGTPDDAQGIARPGRDTLGKWFMVEAPNGVRTIEQQTDLGPGASTGRVMDVSAAAAERMGYSPKSFPTDAIFKFWPIDPPKEVAGLPPVQQAIRYRDIRKAKPMPDPVVQPAAPVPTLPAVLSRSIDVGSILQFVVDHEVDAHRVLTIAVNLHNSLHPERPVALPTAAPEPVAAPSSPSVLQKPSVQLGVLGTIATALLHQTGTIGLDTGMLSGILSLGTAALGATGGWGKAASIGINILRSLAQAGGKP